MGNILSWLRGILPPARDSETIATKISNLHAYLISIIDIDYGLLQTLRSMKVLNSQQIEIITSKKTRSSRVFQLINAVVAMSPEHQEQFLTALNKTQQSHVVEYILANGIQTEAHGDNWPLVVDECYNNIEKNWVKLVETLDSKNGLLDELLSVGCINSQHKQNIEAGKTDAHVNELLLNILVRRSISDYKKFIKCLMTTKNHTVASMLEANEVGNIRTISPERSNTLLAKHALLVAIIDTTNGLLAELLSADCITWRQKQSIEEAATQVKRSTALLEIVARGSESDFDKFMKCLYKTGQHHVSRILKEDGVAVQMVAKINGTENSNRDETCIVEQFMRLFASSSNEEQLLVKVNQEFERLGRDVRLVALDTQGSIRLFYLCKSLPGIHYLHELYSSTELKTHIEELFTLLLDNGRPVILDSLEWNMTDYINCIRNFYASCNLPLFEEIYDTVEKSCCITTHPYIMGFERLPSEMVEMVLINAAVQFFATFNKMTPRAESYTVATLSAVSFIWWRTLTYRQFNKRRLKYYFRQVCRPYKCSPYQLSCITFSADVSGIAQLSNRLYVANFVISNIIQVFTSRPPFSRLADIEVEGLKAPRDIIVCIETSQLYIADWQQCAIWRVNLLSYKQVHKFITTQWLPRGLSIKSRRLLMTPNDGDALFIYGDDGVQLNRIPLPDYITECYAIESSHNTYIVSHWDKFISNSLQEHANGIIEVDINGRIIHQFNNQLDASLQFNAPRYLLIDASNHVIVADRHNERIVLLKPDLQLKRVLIPKLQGQPNRMCFNEESGLLFVGCYKAAEIRVYKMTNTID